MTKTWASKRRTTRMAATALLSLAVLAYVFLIFLPKQQAISQTRRELDDKQQFLLEADRLGFSIRSTNDELNLASEFARDWERRSPSGAALADYYERLSAAAVEAGVSIIKFDPQPVEPMHRIVQLPIHLAVEGSFQQVVTLLHRIESMETTLWIDTLSVEPLAGGGTRVARRNESQGRTIVEGSGEPLVQCLITMQVFADKNKFSD